MKKYNETIKFSGGDELCTTAEGRSGNQALKQVNESDEYQAFVSNHYGETIVSTEIIPVIYPPRYSDITLTNSPFKETWYCVEHNPTSIRVEFKKYHFNDMQNVWPPRNKKKPDPEILATVLKKINDWMWSYFPEMINEQPKLQLLPKNEGAKHGKQPNRKGTVPCFFSMNAEVAEFIKNEAKASGMTQGQFIERMLIKDKAEKNNKY